ncbi:MAG: permease [Candidatus Zixiibacteriota bacterium]
MLLKPDSIIMAATIGRRQVAARLMIYFSFLLLLIDTGYKSIVGITYLTREKCLLFQTLPKWAFSLYENFVELFALVIVGIFIAAAIEKHFARIQRAIPKTPLMAFVYASVIPVCSCSAVPMVRAVNQRIPMRTVITFLVAAPLLNPYIVIISLTVLGPAYAILRVVCSLILAVATGYIVEWFCLRGVKESGKVTSLCVGGRCTSVSGDIFSATWRQLKKLFPYLLIAGGLGVAVELLAPGQLLRSLDLGNSTLGTLSVVAIGVPVYFCNGADVLFLEPLMRYSNLPIGTAMAFSLTSTSVCITSLTLLIRFIGKRLTIVLLTSIVSLTIAMSFLISYMAMFFK